MKTYFKKQLYLLIIVDILVIYNGLTEGFSDSQILFANFILGIVQFLPNIIVIVNHKNEHPQLVIYLIVAILLVLSIGLYISIAGILMFVCFLMAHIYVFMLYEIQRKISIKIP
jgi:hypothetical protein